APSLALDDLWPDVDSPDQFVAHGVRLLLARLELKTLRETVRDFLGSAALPIVAPHLHWFELPLAELAAYLVLRGFAPQHTLQNPTAQLAGVGLLPADHDWSRCESLVLPLVKRLKTQGTWPI